MEHVLLKDIIVIHFNNRFIIYFKNFQNFKKFKKIFKKKFLFTFILSFIY